MEQAAEGTTTMQEQERVIRGFAMARGVAAFDLQIYTDAGISASMPLALRPAGYELMQAVRPGDTVVASKLDRIFRNALDALNVYTDFKKRGIHLVLFDLGTTPITDDSGMSKLIFQVMSAFADHERERIRERMLEGKRAKKDRGGHVGGLARYGFKTVGIGRQAKPEVNPEEQAIIAKVREWRGENPQAPINALARRLNEAGHRARSGKPFQAIQVQRMLDAQTLQ